MAITFSQNIAPNNALSTVGQEAMSGLQGHYRNQAVQQLNHHSHHLHPQSLAALVGSQMKGMRSQTNLKDLIDRMRRRPALIGSRQSAFDALIGETPPLDQQLVRDVVQFLSLLEDMQSGGQGGDDYESAIMAALQASQSEEQKRRILSMARGYFESREDVDLKFLNELNKLSGQYEQLTETIEIAADSSELATLETDPAAIRKHFRRKLREVGDLGELFSELMSLGIETKLLEEIGRDLSALSGADDRAYVRSLTCELSRLWQLTSSHDEVKEVGLLVESHLGRRAKTLNVVELTTEMLSFCSKTIVNQTNASKLLTYVRHAPLQGQVVFANCLMELHSRLPDGIWLSTKDRLVQYSALRILCDRVAEAEEQAVAQAGSE